MRSAPAWRPACRSAASSGGIAWAGASLRSEESCGTLNPSISSSGNAWELSRPWARPATRSSCTSPGRRISHRQQSTPGTAPGCNSAGNTPARTKDDFPQPLIPRIIRKTFPAPDCAISRSVISRVSSSRPKKTGACSGWNAESPRNGEPSNQVIFRSSSAL
jgi:hypothetical protein